DAQIETPVWVDGRLLAKRLLARDPLTSVAYFDAVDLTPGLVPEKSEDIRANANEALGLHYEISIHADMVKLKALTLTNAHSQPPAVGGIRGEIVGFSNASRKRLLEFMASVRYDKQMIFATLTYPDLFPVDDPETWKRHFEAFRRRFERAYPNWRAVWRMELKRRKSGEYAGFLAPHWHFIIFTDNDGGKADVWVEQFESYGKLENRTVSNLSSVFEMWALQAWSEIVNSPDERHRSHGAFAVAVRNRRHAYKYIGKYVAKEENDTHAIGRRWGKIGKFDNAPSRRGTLTRRQYAEFKRQVRKLLAARKPAIKKRDPEAFHNRMKRQKISQGCTVFGLGDGLLSGETNEDWTRLLYRILRNVAEVTGEPIYWLRE
ncbi:hypothetical protein LCGC14_1760030, partial [marine sediment metagenome]